MHTDLNGKKDIVIMGVGNWLMGDEGVGIHFVNAIQNQPWLGEIDAVDGGTGGFHLMQYFEDYHNVILIDATLDGNAAGTIRLIEPRFASDFPRALSSHDIGLRDLVEGLAILGRLPRIYLYVVSVEEVQSQCIELSAPVQNVLPVLEEKVKLLVKTLQEAPVSSSLAGA